MSISFDFKNILTPEFLSFDSLEDLRNATLDTEYASLVLPRQEWVFHEALEMKNQLSDASAIVVIGIGGSNLWTIAITEALFWKFYNQKIDREIYFLDTVDSTHTRDILTILEWKLKKGEKIVTCVISKSGWTAETIALFEYTLSRLSLHTDSIKDYVIAITGQSSKLFKLAEKRGYKILAIPENVGWRYSVFSHVGVFPLLFIGVDVESLLSGARRALDDCLTASSWNPAAMSALMLDYWNKRGINIVDHFFFSTSFESAGKWYRQLLAESIGKAQDRNGTMVHAGITPTVSIGSTDLHSMAQLYFGGPLDKMFVLIKIREKDSILLWNDPEMDSIVSHIQWKTFQSIMDAIYVWNRKVFMDHKIPFYEITLDNEDPDAIWYFLQMKMIEVMILGLLKNVNPFDQPNVEEYKVVTKDILKS